MPIISVLSKKIQGSVKNISVLLFLLMANIAQAQSGVGGWSWGQAWVSGSRTGLPESTVAEVIFNILLALLSLIFILTILAFVGAGIMYIMSFGNHELTNRAKEWITYALIGLVVAVLGYVIVLSVSKLLQGDLSGFTGRHGGTGGSASVEIYDDNGNGGWVDIGPDGDIIIGGEDKHGNGGEVHIDQNGNIDDVDVDWKTWLKDLF